LKAWEDDKDLLNALESVPQTQIKAQSDNDGNTKVKIAYKVWWQGDVSKSRKQVAPLLREAARKA